MELADSLIAAYRDRRVPDAPWNVDVPGLRSNHDLGFDRLEGFARLLLLIGFRLQAGERPAAGLVDAVLTELEGAATAIGSDSPDAWPSPEPLAQSNVEAASLALALTIAREQLWDPLDRTAQDTLAEWMRPALRRLDESNNWVLFGATVGTFLEQTGRGGRDCRKAIKHAWRESDGWHRGGGWFSDGDGHALDYYSAWAFNFYLPLIARFGSDDKRERVAAQRLAEFVPALAAMIDADGAPVFFGRSLTYRFGLLAPLWLDQWIGNRTLAPGHCRELATRSLDWFLDAGAIDDGLLTVGWRGPDESLAQTYSCAASPLWAGKAFAGLLLPADDPAWTEPESERLAGTQRIEIPGATIVNDPAARVAKLHSRAIGMWRHGAIDREFAALYDRQAWSSASRPAFDGPLADNAFVPAGFEAESLPRRTEVDGLSAQTFDGGNVYSLVTDHAGIELRAYKASGFEPGMRFVATSWAPVDGAHCQTLPLIGFDAVSESGAFAVLHGSGEDGIFLLATRISREPFAEPLAEAVELERTGSGAVVSLRGIDRVRIEFAPRLKLAG